MKREYKILLTILLVILVLLILFGILLRHPANPRPGGNTNVGPVLSDGWILPENNNQNYIWGLADGIAIGIQKNSKPPQMDNAPGGTWAPGLIYVMFTDEKGETYFFNYIGFDILGKNGLDQSEAEKIVFMPESTSVEGSILTVVFRTSEFNKNKIPLKVTITIDKSKPREIGISAQDMYKENNLVSYIHMSATGGNLGRIRDLYLKDEIINSKNLYAGEQPGSGCFYPLKTFALNKLRTDSSGVIAYAGNDEAGNWFGEWGSDVAPYYGKPKFYQYWRKYSGTYNPDLMVTVNGRDHYFSGFLNPCNGKAVTGGVAYENFDMVEKYYAGQKFWFGYSYDLNA
ncbi:Uncharacterised protein [uncultured archaeon]|nr:Uncharacterised protein [uncultured archaeon]